MQWKDGLRANPLTRVATNLQRAVALVQSGSTQTVAEHLQRSLIQLASVERLLQLRVQWDPGQVERQRQRLVRQQARLQWQQAVLKHLWEERER